MIRVRFSTHAEHSQAVKGISPPGDDAPAVSTVSARIIRYLVRTRGQGYLGECDRNKDHKENRDYKEEGHVASFIVSVARHGRREILQARVLVYRLVAARVGSIEIERKGQAQVLDEVG